MTSLNAWDHAADQRAAAEVADASEPLGHIEPTVNLTTSLRTEFFSDAVLAITIALLTFELRLPAYEPDRLLSALLAEWPAYLAVALSFTYAGTIWLHHHALFSRIRRMDAGLHWMNLALLLTVAVLPFPTRVLAQALAEGSATDARVAVGFYALVGVVITAAWTPVYPYLRRRPHLLAHPRDADSFRAQQQRIWIGAILFAIAGAVGFFSPVLGLLNVVVLVLFHAVTYEQPVLERVPIRLGSGRGPQPRHIHRVRQTRRAEPDQEGSNA